MAISKSGLIVIENEHFFNAIGRLRHYYRNIVSIFFSLMRNIPLSIFSIFPLVIPDFFFKCSQYNSMKTLDLKHLNILYNSILCRNYHINPESTSMKS